MIFLRKENLEALGRKTIETKTQPKSQSTLVLLLFYRFVKMIKKYCKRIYD